MRKSISEVSHEQIKFLGAKRKNRRITIFLIKEKETGEHSFMIHTRRLVDFNKRIIGDHKVLYSVETFCMLQKFFDMFTEDMELTNKVLLKEINEIEQWAVSTDLNE